MLSTSQVATLRHHGHSRATEITPSPLDGPGTPDAIELMGTMMSFPQGVEVYGEGEPAEYLYKIVSGAVRIYTVLHDGRRQIGGFYLPGDLLGPEFSDEHAFSAEAVTDTKVLVIKRSSLIALSARNTEVAHQLLALTGIELKRMQDHVVLLIKSAQERVATFLLDMADRIARDDVLELPMLRQDIADYLGLTVETVSRMLTMLEASAAIQLTTSKRIVVRNRPALARLNGSGDGPMLRTECGGH